MDEVVIIGGGPAGATLGAYLSLAGIRNVIFESAIHPRPHVGESLVPATTRVFKEIGFLDTLDASGFPRKHGAAWHPTRKQGKVLVKFRKFALRDVAQDYSYHVDRGRFDLLLLKHAEKLGSRICQGVRVKRVLFDDGRVCGVELDVAGRTMTRDTRLVADASGRKTLLGRQLGLKQADPLFNQFAVHAWYSGVDRGAAETAEYIHIYFLPLRRAWAWQIPISDRITSVGVVTEKESFKDSGEDRGAWFEEMINSAPDIAHAMRSAHRENDFVVEADYSYSMESFVGNGYLLLGDAARFVDPIFSSGISVALYSAKFAAERIVEAFATGDLSEAALKPYEEKLRHGTKVWYEFIRLYYKLLPMFTHFIKSEKYKDQLLELFSGDVYDRDEVPVLDAMREFVQGVEGVEDHIFKPYVDTSIPLD